MRPPQDNFWNSPNARRHRVKVTSIYVVTLTSASCRSTADWYTQIFEDVIIMGIAFFDRHCEYANNATSALYFLLADN